MNSQLVTLPRKEAKTFIQELPIEDKTLPKFGKVRFVSNPTIRLSVDITNMGKNTFKFHVYTY